MEQKICIDIIAIGNRDDMEVYRNAFQRVKDR